MVRHIQSITLFRLTKTLSIDRSIWANSVIDCAGFMDEYFRNSLEKESEQMDRIRAAVRDAGIFVVLGYSERDKGSLYIAQVRSEFRGLIVEVQVC